MHLDLCSILLLLGSNGNSRQGCPLQSPNGKKLEAVAVWEFGGSCNRQRSELVSGSTLWLLALVTPDDS